MSWEHERWSRGGYAFFDPQFPPSLRYALARPFGRIFFAGEHTSLRWQGYMNGAVETGLRAAEEVIAHAENKGLRDSTLRRGGAERSSLKRFSAPLCFLQ